MMAKKKKASRNSAIKWTGSRDLSVKAILPAKDGKQSQSFVNSPTIAEFPSPGLTGKRVKNILPAKI